MPKRLVDLGIGIETPKNQVFGHGESALPLQPVASNHAGNQSAVSNVNSEQQCSHWNASQQSNKGKQISQF